MPYEESGELRQAAARHGLVLIPLIAPTTPGKRMGMILKDAGGFVYYIMVKGVTGARDAVALDVAPQLRLMRTHTKLPIAAGFGVSNGEQARAVAASADGVVVGSALVKAAQEKRLPALVKEIRAALTR
jgi:tryptophan synthase alpha chain